MSAAIACCWIFTISICEGWEHVALWRLLMMQVISS